MKKFLLGFISGFFVGLILLIVSFFVGQKVGIIPPFLASTEDATEGDCQAINPDVSEYGDLGITLLYNGTPAQNVETNLAKTPGADAYCYEVSDDSGILEFKDVPVGEYFIYFNMTTYPEEYGVPSAEVQVSVTKGKTSEYEVEITDYQK